VEHIVNGELKRMLKNLLEFLQGGMYALSVVMLAQLLYLLWMDRSVEGTMLLLITLSLSWNLLRDFKIGIHT
tara:strand:- start:6668 stop:6883 length:216 start_codon:yes stop_codon:yes gene_type:complete